VVKTVKGPAGERQEISVRQFDLHPKLVADIDVFLPTGKTAADADLLHSGLLLFPAF